MHSEAKRLIDVLDLRAHPEGGWYRETHRSTSTVATRAGTRSACTSIYFLLTAEAFSAFHRIASDETWHFYRGDAVMIDVIAEDGGYVRHALGIRDTFQATVPGGAYFSSHVEGELGYALVGCDVAPGFDFADFELCERAGLRAKFPQHAVLIERYTRVRTD